VLKKATSPLLPTKVFDSSAKMPLRSRRIAAQPLSKVPVAKRGEILIMQRLGLAPAQNGERSQHDFEALFEGSDRESHVEAMRELFPGRLARCAPRVVAPCTFERHSLVVIR